MSKRIRTSLLRDLCACFVALCFVFPARAQSPPSDPAAHAFPALGVSADRKVAVEWNRFYDCAGFEAILRGLHEKFPELTELYSIGKSVDGREIWCLEVTSKKKGAGGSLSSTAKTEKDKENEKEKEKDGEAEKDKEKAGSESPTDDRRLTTDDSRAKPAMWIDGNTHGNEVQAGEIVLYTAWYLCHQYGRLEKITQLLDERVFYLVPTINPDGRDRWFHTPQNMHTSRTGVRPLDNDKDGAFDEDDSDDLDGDGSITEMRIKDPNGRWKIDTKYPDLLMEAADADEAGEYTRLGWEGIDNDGDGKVNEDGVGGYDGNRNWPFDWQPNYLQYGAQEYPFSLPESRAVGDFVLAHPNIAAMQSYHNNGGMILRGPGREGGEMQPADDAVMRHIAAQGEKIIPAYDSLVIWKDLYTVWGGEVDWFYGGRGILCFTNELWTAENLYRTKEMPDNRQEAYFIQRVLMNDGLTKWKEFDHPTYGKIEIGGMRKEWSRVPPSFLLEEECHRNMAFTLYHADQMPLARIADIKTEKLGDGLHKVWVTVENSRLTPTRTAQDVEHKIGPPDVVTLAGEGIKVVSSGVVKDRFFKKVEATKRRPERVELETIGGMSAERVQFIVSGAGPFMARLETAKGGGGESEGVLQP